MNIDLGQMAIALAGALLSGVVGFVGWLVKKVLVDVKEIKIDVEVMKTRIVEALELRNQVSKLSENLIRLDEREQTMKKDINALHDAKRELYQRIGGKS